MKLWKLKELPSLPKLKLAVIGHIEWVTFLAVNEIPKPGTISHSRLTLEEPAGGGSVVAIQMSKLIKGDVHFFTALGNDLIGEKSYATLKSYGLKLSVAWRDKPTRKAISMVDTQGERAITVMGERLQPTAEDDLPWDELSKYDGIFLTAADSQGIKFARQANILVATPRVGIKTINESNVLLDGLIGSALDPGEKVNEKELLIKPKLRISTMGAKGGNASPGGRFKAIKLESRAIDTYGCGDSFAAGLTTGLAANFSYEQAISLGTHIGANCAANFGPYSKDNS